MTVQNPHDRFFRRTLGEREMAQEFLRHYLPPALREQLDLDSLQPTTTTLVDEDLAEHQNDLLYEVKTTAGHDLYLYILLEHKSHPDKWVLLQLLRYMLKLWQKEAEENAPFLRPILPVLVYHGEVIWPFSTAFSAYFAELAPELRPYVPEFTAVLYDLSPKADIKIEGDLPLQAVLLALRHILDRRLAERLAGLINFIFQMAHLSQDQRGVRLRDLIIYYYLVATTKVSRAQMEQALKLQGSLGEDVMRTIAMEYLEEGRQEGWQKGRLEGRQEGTVLTLQEATVNILKARFMVIPALLEQRLKQTNDTAVLHEAVRQAALVPDIDQFINWFDNPTLPTL
jgi:predicted transposase/invertase (TIGR01784 family)